MGFDLDKHDLFRNGVPGFVFLFVLFSFYYANNDFILQNNHNITTFLSIMAIAITLPIGYLIHNIYRAIHILTELSRWEKDESETVHSILSHEQINNLISGNFPRDKQISWFIESCLLVKGSEPIRERGYQLISRVHSLGGSIVAVLGGTVLSIFYLSYRNRIIEHWQMFILISLAWITICFLLRVARTSTFTNYQILIRHFVNMREELIRSTASKSTDPFK